jgi:hypothetical protein
MVNLVATPVDAGEPSPRASDLLRQPQADPQQPGFLIAGVVAFLAVALMALVRWLRVRRRLPASTP